ncbi:MAG: VWA domain-containing protein [Spirochaetales bacterium]
MKCHLLFRTFAAALFLWGSLTLPGQEIKAGDVRVEAREDGYHVFVRAAGLASALLTEAFELPNHSLATYALRSQAPTAVAKDEKRLLNGKFLTQPHNSLISSTPVSDPVLGTAFHLLIPPVVEYGNKANPNTRWGQVDVRAQLSANGTGFWFSIRGFSKPFADYTGTYRDNAFELKTLQVQRSVPTGEKYEKGLVEGFSRLGDSYQASDIKDALDRINRAVDRSGDSLDMVLAIDTTKSMLENLKAVKANLLGPIREEVKRFKTFRIGLVFYCDYMENYLTRVVSFQSDLDAVQRELDKAKAEGGGDIPEAVVEALYAGLTQFDWKAENRVILLLGDAPQHPTPRGSVTEAQMHKVADDKKVELQLILLPQTLY